MKLDLAELNKVDLGEDSGDNLNDIDEREDDAGLIPDG